MRPSLFLLYATSAAAGLTAGAVLAGTGNGTSSVTMGSSSATAMSGPMALPPLRINYTGKFYDNTGAAPHAAVPNSASNVITFEIFDSPTGGTSLFGPETQTVSSKDGVVSAVIGSVVPMTPAQALAIAQAGHAYLQVTFDSQGPGVGLPAELFPRTEMTSSLFAIHAATATDVPGAAITPSSVDTTGTGTTPNSIKTQNLAVTGQTNLGAVSTSSLTVTGDVLVQGNTTFINKPIFQNGMTVSGGLFIGGNASQTPPGTSDAFATGDSFVTFDGTVDNTAVISVAGGGAASITIGDGADDALILNGVSGSGTGVTITGAGGGGTGVLISSVVGGITIQSAGGTPLNLTGASGINVDGTLTDPTGALIIADNDGVLLTSSGKIGVSPGALIYDGSDNYVSGGLNIGAGIFNEFGAVLIQDPQGITLDAIVDPGGTNGTIVLKGSGISITGDISNATGPVVFNDVQGVTINDGGLAVLNGGNVDIQRPILNSNAAFDSGRVQVNDDLHVTGSFTVDTGNINLTGPVTISDSGSNPDLIVNGEARFTNTVDLQGTISNSAGNVTVGDNFTVSGGNATVLTGTLDAQGNISNSGGNVTVADSIDLQDAIQNSTGSNGGAVFVNDDLTVQNNVAVNGTISFTNTSNEAVEIRGGIFNQNSITDAADSTEPVIINDHLQVFGKMLVHNQGAFASIGGLSTSDSFIALPANSAAVALAVDGSVQIGTSGAGNPAALTVEGTSIFAGTNNSANPSIVTTHFIDAQGGIQNSTGDVTIPDNVNISNGGNLIVAGTITSSGQIGGPSLNISGAASVGSLATTTSASIGSSLTVGTTAVVSGSITGQNGLTINNAVTNLNAGVDVTGLTQLTGAVNQIGGGAVSISGATVINNTLGVNNTLTVTAGGAVITGNSSIAGTFTQSGGGAVSLSGPTQVNNTLGVTGLITGNNGVTITAGGANITGVTTITGNTSVTGTFTQNGGANAVSFAGATTINNTLNVTGATTLTGGATISGGVGLAVTGATNLTGVLNQLGAGNNVSFDGATTVNNTLHVTGAATFDSTGLFTGLLTANGGVNAANVVVVGNESIGGNLSVTGTSLLTGLVTANGGMNLSGGGATTLSVTGNTSMTGTLNVTSNTTINGNLRVDGTSDLRGDIFNNTGGAFPIQINDPDGFRVVNGPVVVGSAGTPEPTTLNGNLTVNTFAAGAINFTSSLLGSAVLNVGTANNPFVTTLSGDVNITANQSLVGGLNQPYEFRVGAITPNNNVPSIFGGSVTVLGDTGVAGGSSVVTVGSIATAAQNVPSNFNGNVSIFSTSANSSTLQVGANAGNGVVANFNSDVTIGDNTSVDTFTVHSDTSTIGDAATDNLTVNATALFTSPVTMNQTLLVHGKITDDLNAGAALQVDGDTVIGNTSADSLTVNATSTFTASVNFNSATVTYADAATLVINSNIVNAMDDAGDVWNFNAGAITAADGTTLTVNSSATTIGNANSDTLGVQAATTFTGTSLVTNDSVAMTLNSNVVNAMDDGGDVWNFNAGLITFGDSTTLVVNSGSTTVGNSAGDSLTVNATTTFNANVVDNGNLTVNGNTILGDSSGDSLTVNATSVFQANVTMNANTTIGDSSSDALVVNATSTFNANVTDNANLTVNGNTTLGDSAGDALTVIATSTFQNNVTMNANVTIGNAGSDVLQINSTTAMGSNPTPFNGGSNVIPGNALSIWGNTSFAGTHVMRRATNGAATITLDGETGKITAQQLSVTGQKNFIAPNPADAKTEFVYVAQEGAEAGVYDRGTREIKAGRTRIEMKESFAMVASEQDLTAYVTPVGKKASVWVVEQAPGYLVVESDVDVKVNWRVDGIRSGFEDHNAKQINTHFLPKTVDEVNVLPAGVVAQLKKNGLVNADGTPNLELINKVKSQK